MCLTSSEKFCIYIYSCTLHNNYICKYVQCHHYPHFVNEKMEELAKGLTTWSWRIESRLCTCSICVFIFNHGVLPPPDSRGKPLEIIQSLRQDSKFLKGRKKIRCFFFLSRYSHNTDLQESLSNRYALGLWEERRKKKKEREKGNEESFEKFWKGHISSKPVRLSMQSRWGQFYWNEEINGIARH